MNRKLLLIGLGAAVGYVLGTRQGRGAYEQMKSQAQRVWRDPKVQKTVSGAQDFAREQTAVVKDKVADVTSKVQNSNTPAENLPGNV
jgi:hypothetical protein